MTKCPECGGFEIDTCVDGLHCRNCGLVIDESPIRNNYIPENIKKNASLPGFMSNGTMPIDGKYVKHHWLLSTREKNLFKAKKKLELISSKLRLPKRVEEEAYMIFKNAVEKELNIGRNNQHFIYGSVYASCIMHNIPKTSLEITAFTDVDKNKMLNAFKVLKIELNLNLDQISPSDLVQRFGSRLKLKQTTITKAVEILRKLKDSIVVAGKHPKTIAASALYLATRINDDYRTQREVANATGIIEVTLRKRSKEIAKEISF